MNDKRLDKGLQRQAAVMLAQVRRELGVTQEDMFDTHKIDLGPTGLSRYENGKKGVRAWDIVRYVQALMEINYGRTMEILKWPDMAHVRDAVREAVADLRETYAAIFEDDDKFIVDELDQWYAQLGFDA